MIVLDVNILIAGFRDDHPHHERARRWLVDTIASGAVIGVPDIVWVGYLRLCTNPRIFPVASTIDEAFEFIRAVTAVPGYVPLGGLRDGIEPFLHTVSSSDATGNLTTDAYIATVALSLAAEVATFDRDFRRFDGLRIIEPT